MGSRYLRSKWHSSGPYAGSPGKQSAIFITCVESITPDFRQRYASEREVLVDDIGRRRASGNVKAVYSRAISTPSEGDSRLEGSAEKDNEVLEFIPRYAQVRCYEKHSSNFNGKLCWWVDVAERSIR